MEPRRVVVTGLGTVNPIGGDVDAFWKQAQSGVSGVGKISAFDASHLKVGIAAEVPDFQPEQYLDKKEARRMDRYAQFFWAATSQAMSDSGLDFTDDYEGATRAGVAVGSGIGGIISFQNNLDVMRDPDRGPDRISPFAIPQIISNMAAGLASISFNLLGPNTATVTACAASANAIGEAIELHSRPDAKPINLQSRDSHRTFPLSEQSTFLLREGRTSRVICRPVPITAFPFRPRAAHQMMWPLSRLFPVVLQPVDHVFEQLALDLECDLRASHRRRE